MKYRYRRLQAGLARDLNALCNNDIHKVYILQGIRWICSEWKSFRLSLIANCWHHTTVLNDKRELERPIDLQIQEHMQALRDELANVVQSEANNMNFSNLLCPPTESGNLESI